MKGSKNRQPGTRCKLHLRLSGWWQRRPSHWWWRLLCSWPSRPAWLGPYAWQGRIYRSIRCCHLSRLAVACKPQKSLCCAKSLLCQCGCAVSPFSGVDVRQCGLADCRWLVWATVQRLGISLLVNFFISPFYTEGSCLCSACAISSALSESSACLAASLHCDAACCGVLQCIAACCSVMPCVALCCSVLVGVCRVPLQPRQCRRPLRCACKKL